MTSPYDLVSKRRIERRSERLQRPALTTVASWTKLERRRCDGSSRPASGAMNRLSRPLTINPGWEGKSDALFWDSLIPAAGFSAPRICTRTH